MKLLLASGLAAILLIGCASAYQPYSYFGGGGWREAQLADNTFKVTFEANGYTSKTQATDMALLRAAELTLAHGFNYFVVGTASDDSRSATYTAPSTTNANINAYGNTANVTAQTYGGQTYLFTFPAPSITVVCFKDRPAFNTTIYDAALVARSMKSQYGIK